MRTRKHLSAAMARQQSGVIMLITLIALVILMLGGVALVRSMSTAALSAGNYAVKRDMQNQAERGLQAAVAILSTGALKSETARTTSLLSSNYAATTLAVNTQGIPNALVNDATFSSLGMSGADISDSSTGINIRYVIDRLCSAGTSAFSTSACQTTASSTAPQDVGGTNWLPKPAAEARPVFRISVRVTDTRRNTQSYVQLIVAV